METKSASKDWFYVIVDKDIMTRESAREYSHAIIVRDDDSKPWRDESWSSNFDLARERAKRLSNKWNQVEILEARKTTIPGLQKIKQDLARGISNIGTHPSTVVKKYNKGAAEEVSEEFSRKNWGVVSDHYNKENEEAEEAEEEKLQGGEPVVVKPEPEPITDAEKLEAIQSIQDLPGLGPMLEMLKVLNPELYNKALALEEKGKTEKTPEPAPQPERIQAPAQEFRINLDPDRFVGGLSVEPSEEEVLKYLVDLLNEAGLDGELRYKNGEFKIAVGSALVTVPRVVMDDDRLRVIVQAAQGFADELDSSDEFESWFAYRKGTYYLCIKQMAA